MAKVKITSSGTYTVGNDETIEIDIPGGGDVTLVGPAGPDNITKLKISFGANDTQSDVVTVDLSTFAQDGLELDISKYDPSDQLILQGATIVGVDPTDSSKMIFTYVGEDGGTYSGLIQLKDGQEKDFNDPMAPIIICFAQGSLILTETGEVPVESLKVGDMVMTRDCGLQPICWIGSRSLDSIDLAMSPQLFPVRICKGAFGANLPTRDLLVSPQHRFCLGGSRLQLLFGLEEVLVAAKHLVNGNSILSDTSIASVTYFHILFSQHQIVYSSGSPSESLHTGKMALSGLSQNSRDEIDVLFPELPTGSRQESRTALPVLSASEARAMLSDQAVDDFELLIASNQ